MGVYEGLRNWSCIWGYIEYLGYIGEEGWGIFYLGEKVIMINSYCYLGVIFIVVFSLDFCYMDVRYIFLFVV